MMGDAVTAAAVVPRARVEGGPPGRALRIVHNGVIVATVPVVTDPFTFDFPATATGFWRIETMIGASYQALSNPIFVVFPMS